MNKYLADTTVFIEHLRGNLHAKEFLESQKPSISTVTIAELLQGARDKQEVSSVMKLCASFSDIAIDKKVSHKSLDLLEQFHLSHGLLFLDALIAAIALENNMILVTGNMKHFKYLPTLQVISQETVFR